MKKVAALALVLALVGIACGGTKVYVRPESPTPDPAADKFLIMPVAIKGLPGDNTAQQAALFGGIVAAFKEQAVPLQPIQPVLEAAGMGNMGEKIADGMYHMVSFHNSYDFSEDAGYHGGNSEYAFILDMTAKLVETVAEQLKLDFKPKYSVVAVVESTGSSLPKTVGYRVIAGVYNLEERKVDRVVWYDTKTADDPAAVLAEMGTLGGKLQGLLMSGGE